MQRYIDKFYFIIKIFMFHNKLLIINYKNIKKFSKKNIVKNIYIRGGVVIDVENSIR